MTKETRKKDNTNIKQTKRNNHLTTWQCFQKEYVPHLEGKRESRNKEAAKVWGKKTDEEKSKYVCSVESNNNRTKKSFEENHIDKILKKISEAIHFRVYIPELNYKSDNINYEMLKNIISKSEEFINKKDYKKCSNYKDFIKKISQAKELLMNIEEDSDKSANYLEDELNNINQTPDVINSLSQDVENYNINGQNNLILEEAKSRKLQLIELENLIALGMEFENLDKKKFNEIFTNIKNIIKIVREENDDSIKNSEIFIRLEQLYKKMQNYKFIITTKPLTELNLITEKITIKK